MTQVLLWAAVVSLTVLWPGIAFSRKDQETPWQRRFRRFGGLVLAVVFLAVLGVMDYFRI